MAGGYIGKILRVDLTKYEVLSKPVDSGLIETYLGGKGFGARILFDDVRKDIDPLGTENEIIFSTGPLTGTLAPGSSKFEVVTKSPLTGTFLNSDCGGCFGGELKFAGYDAIVIKGRACRPVFLSINSGKAEIRDAEGIWGRKTSDTERIIREDLNDEEAKIACIGPAGEKLTRISCIWTSRSRTAARGGAGAVMGSKNLKAISVRGNGDIKIAQPTKFLEAIDKVYEEIEPLFMWAPSIGTAATVSIANLAGILPTRNFQTGVFEEADSISHEALMKNSTRSVACFPCPGRCGKLTSITTGPYAGTIVEVEYETIYALGSNCGVSSMEAIAKANSLCDEYGIDTMSTGCTIAFAMECYQRGIIGKQDTNGIELEFGDHNALVQMVEKIGKRDGFGGVLAEGSVRASQIIGKGAENYVMHSKKLELGGYDPRGMQGVGLGFATSDRGGCHQRSAGLVGAELLAGKKVPADRYVDRFEIDGRAKLVKDMQDWSALLDSTGLCWFVGSYMKWVTVAEILSAATGISFNEHRLRLIGERIWNLTRMFNVREGFTSKEDSLPERFLKEPMPEGPSKGYVCRLNEMLSDYYAIRGWDEKGIPTAKTIKRLDIM